jgi:DNA-directed RNA polymerase specialized sigma24 family protein
MAVFTEAEVAVLDPMVRAQAEKVAARYQAVEADDLAQEVWVWIMEESSPALRGYIANGQPGALKRSLYHAAVNWCEKDKKRRLAEQGYNWRDDYTYTRPEVARLLPVALDPSAVPGLSGGELHDGPAAKTDPAHGGGMLASLIDVRTAFAKLSDGDQAFVLTVVGFDCRWADIAATTGIKAESAYAKWMRILDRMVTRHLGRKTDDD